MNTKDLLSRILKRPTAPFYEKFVIQEIESIAREHGLPFCYDKAGNLIVGVSHTKALAKGRRLVLFAHTDHPGFHLNVKGNSLSAKWFGGAPFKDMSGATLRVFDSQTGRSVAKAKLNQVLKKGYSRLGVPFSVTLSRPLESGRYFGAFDFPGIRFVGSRVHTRAADDLAGCAIALGALLDQQKRGSLVSIFTRGEEVGYIGCLALLKAVKFSKETVAVSLEASRTLPGAVLGQGPVLRLGDKSTVFDQSACAYLLHVAETQQKRRPKFLFQRRIMDGGSCEATALNLYGLRTTGLAVPLKNYHNQGNSRPAAECVDIRDVEAGRIICAEAAKSIADFSKVSNKLSKSLDQNFASLKRFLEYR